MGIHLLSSVGFFLAEQATSPIVAITVISKTSDHKSHPDTDSSPFIVLTIARFTGEESTYRDYYRD